MFNPINGAGASTIALQGLNRAQNQFSNAAADVVNSYSSAANGLSASKLGASAVSQKEITAKSDNPESAVVDMLQAKHAVKANLKVLQADHDMQKDVIDMMRGHAEKRGQRVDIKA